MGNFDAISFRELVDIKRNDGDTCEYEVCEKAMKWYEQYPCYKDDWERSEFQNSIDQYFDFCRNEREDYKKNNNYKGAYLLVNKHNKTLALTADILTSIKSPFGKSFPDLINSLSNMLNNKEWKRITGEEVKKYILNVTLDDDLVSNKELMPYVKAFANVYYWCGNMMPVVFNPTGLGDRDTWRNKVLFLKGDKEETNLNKWDEWKREFDDDWISALYLQDAINDEDKKVKPFYEGLDDVGQVFFSKRKGFNQQMWFLNNAKFIIQRSYRIQNGFHGNWNDKDKEIVQQIFKKVFETAGLNYENNQKLLELF